MNIINLEIDYYGRFKPEVETEMDIAMYVTDKMDIVTDFFPKMKSKDKQALRDEMLKLKSKRAIDIYFRNYIYAHI